jgi:hemerythrin-like domain-containing protein
MGPIEILADEHRVILQAVALLERRLDGLDSAEVLNPVWFREMLQFLRTFADRRHHGKEEDQLFPLMVERLDYPSDAGPIAVLTRDHHAARALVQGMESALELEDEKAAVARLMRDGHAYAQILRAHIDREDDKVFPTVEDLLDPEDAARLVQAFQHFEATLPPIDPSALLMKLGRQ